jgi:tryptophan synthase alpha chain
MTFYAQNGADIIEVGVPFSDPMADGPVIQSAMERALKAGTTLEKVLELVYAFRKGFNTPIILMGYLNPFYAYGLEGFCKRAKEVGVDGILTVDMPPEEAHYFTALQRKEGLLPIFLTTPVTTKERVKKIKEYAQGFVYFVSITGVTGERKELPSDTKKMLEWTKKLFKMPVVLGFGISSPEIIKEFYAYADGFVVGSSLVKRANLIWGNSEEKKNFEEYFKSLANACHGYKIK